MSKHDRSNMTFHQVNVLYNRIEELEAENERLREALGAIVNKYVANIGTEHEFICCITPKHASKLSFAERVKDPTWSVFDKARALLSEKEQSE